VCLRFYLRYNEFRNFFGRSSKQLFNFYAFKKFIIPADTVFLNNIFYMFILSAQGLYPGSQRDVFFKTNMQQNQMFDDTG